MDHCEGAGKTIDARLGINRWVHFEFQRAKLRSDGGLLVMPELHDALRLSDLAPDAFHDSQLGKNTTHQRDSQLRQSVLGKLAGYEDVNDAKRLSLDPGMRQIVVGRAVDPQAASAS